MAKKVFKVGEIKCAEDVLKFFDAWTEVGAEGRKTALAKAGEEKRITVKNPNAWIHFYDTGAVYVSFGKFHSIRLWSGYDPVNSYTNKAGETKDYPLTWSCDKYYSTDNVNLMKALSKAF